MKPFLKEKLLFLALLLLIGNLFPKNLEGRLYFMHVPKTGGTSLRLLLEQQLSTEEIYPFRNLKSAKGAIKEALVSGHLPYWFCKNLDATFEDAFKVTILRDPVERYLSFLRAKKKADNELLDLESVLQLRLQPQNKYQEGLVDNALCRYLSDNPRLEGQELLNSAKENLKTFDCVIFFDNFEQDVLNLFSRLGITLESKDIPKINTTTKEPVSPQVLKEVKRLNELDMQLYEYAKSSLQPKTTEYVLRTESFIPLLQRSTAIDYTYNLPLNGRGWTYREALEDKTAPYSIYRWVMDQPAEIYFSLEEGSDYDLYFYAQPLTIEVEPRVCVNGQEIVLSRLNTDPFSLYHGIIPKETLKERPTELSFFSSAAFQYREVYPNTYNRNHPPLSFAVSRIQLFKAGF